MKTYTAKVVRSGNWWAVEVQELDGVFTQARRLDQVEFMARDVIAGVLDVSPLSFEVQVLPPALSPRLDNCLNDVLMAQIRARAAAEEASRKTQEIARLLHEEEHMPLRDVGKILGVSHQRAHQLVSK